jgi:aspartate/methionine/tyrosine aminotransferase
MPFAIPFADRIELLLQIAASEAPPAEEAAVPFNVSRAIEEALDRGETHYTDRPGILPLRQAVAASLNRRFALNVNAKNDVIITCGLTEARFLATQQVLQPGDAISTPACVERISGPAILRRLQITEAAENALYLTSSTPEATLRRYLSAAPSRAWIFYEVDEDQSRFHPSHVPGCENRTLTLGALGAHSGRVGYLAAPAAFSSGLRDFKQNLTICTTNLSQWAALAGMEGEL